MLKHATWGLLVQLQDGFLVCTLTMHWFIQEKFCSCDFWMFESQGCYMSVAQLCDLGLSASLVLMM
jgi:hypothetical protein